jgi:hypothetical protein
VCVCARARTVYPLDDVRARITCTLVGMPACLYVCMSVCLYICMPVHLYTCMLVSLYVCMWCMSRARTWPGYLPGLFVAAWCCAPLGAARPACRRPGPRPPGPRAQAPGRRRASAAPVMRLRGGSGGQRPWEREQSMPDYYAMLGVAPGAGDQELRKAHKKMMLLYHPDKNAGSKVAQERFVRIQVSACPSRAFARGRRACAVLLEDAARRARAMPCVLTLAVVGRAGRVLGALASGSPQRI